MNRFPIFTDRPGVVINSAQLVGKPGAPGKDGAEGPQGPTGPVQVQPVNVIIQVVAPAREPARPLAGPPDLMRQLDLLSKQKEAAIRAMKFGNKAYDRALIEAVEVSYGEMARRLITAFNRGGRI